jgi:hypothetical protein
MFLCDFFSKAFNRKVRKGREGIRIRISGKQLSRNRKATQNDIRKRSVYYAARRCEPKRC